MAPTLTTITGSLYNPASGTKITTGALIITPTAIVISNDCLVSTAPVTISVPGTGDLSFTLAANPSGPAYTVEYDPDPADTSTPTELKAGYFKSSWLVPATGPVDLASL